MRINKLLDITRPIAVIDCLRLAAPAPLFGFNNDVTAVHGICRSALRWRKHTIPHFFMPYIYTVAQLSRYHDGRYEKKLEEIDASFQNNQYPYTYKSAAKFVRQALDSYTSFSTRSSVLDGGMLNITMIECAFDLPATVPTLSQLIRHVLTGSGAATRRLKIKTYDGNEYRYFKQHDVWRDKFGVEREIEEQEYFKQLTQWNWSVYAGSKNYRILIYRKDDRIRHEIRYNGNAAVKKALFSKRHVSALEDRETVETLLRETAKRIYELYGVKEIRSVENAINDALASFPAERQEPCVAEHVAFHIDLGVPAVNINQVNVIIAHAYLTVQRAASYLSKVHRIRAPPV